MASKQSNFPDTSLISSFCEGDGAALTLSRPERALRR